MPSALVIPGVQVRTEFEPSPVLPGATGILGVAGVVDRGPIGPTPAGNFGEFIDLFGPASRYTMPEVRLAFANGIQQVLISRIEPGRGQKAFVDLLDDEGEKVATIEARAEGIWGNNLGVKVTQVKTLSGLGIKYVNVEISLDGQVIETFNNLNLDINSPDYLFDRINSASRVVVAVDPLFAKALPIVMARTAMVSAPARAAFGRLKAGTIDVVRAVAKQEGPNGNRIAVRVRDGAAALSLLGTGDAASVRIRARRTGPDGTGIRIAVQAAGANAVNIVVTPPTGAPRSAGPFASVDEIVAGLANDPDVVPEKLGNALPVARAATPLARRVNIEVLAEGRDPATYQNLPNVDVIKGIDDPLVQFDIVGNATQLPDPVDGVPLAGGRDTAPALQLRGDNSEEPLLELVLAPNVDDNVSVSISRAVSTIDGATAVVNVSVFVSEELAEEFPNLTMDPDDPNYLPAVLQTSGLIRAHDLFVRSKATTFPRQLAKPVPLANAGAPTPDDYQSALERLEAAEEVDLVIASVNNQLSSANIRVVHQQVVAHCTKMADVARNRIGIGSVSSAESSKVAEVLDHANDVRSDHFILTAPVGTDAALAGLLGRQDYFQSPTFKTVANPGVPAGKYTDAQLIQLINGSVLVINEKSKLGIIVIKGLLTSGRQVNVQRTANKAVRDVKAIADVYIGLLNNEGARNALKQQITALLLQMERDGAIVPSTDGKDPSFRVDVYSTQADFANGIVRIDIAVRPVRAIDYIYATLLVKN